MYSDELTENKDPVELEIHPLSKWKRILVFLSDYFISFAIAFVFLNVAIAPLFSWITKADERGAAIRNTQSDSDNVLYGNKLLFYVDNDPNNKNYNLNFEHTCYRFLSYYVLDDSIKSYGPNIDNEVFFTFYNNIRTDKAKMVEIYKTQNQGHNYFVFDESKLTSFYLKDEVRNELKLFYFFPDEKLSEKGEEYKENLSNFFMVIYKALIDDINKNDLTYNGISYKESIATYQALINYDHWIMTTCLLISYILSWGAVYLLIPLISKTGKTIGMMILKSERVDYKRLTTFRKGDVALTSLYSLFLNMSFMFFLPLTFSSSGFIYVITLPMIALLSIISVLLILVSFFVLMFTNFNRTLSDFSSRSVMVVQDDLDAIYRYKGYYK